MEENKNIVFDESKKPGAFDYDKVAFTTVCDIILREGCSDFIETGTFMGGTSLGIQQFFPELNVWTVESDEQLFKNALARFSKTKIKAFLGDSVTVLRDQIIKNLKPRPFFYLDSHVSAYNVSMNQNLKEYYPLKEEILEISKIKSLRPIIAIHDFYNPVYHNYGFDKDHGVPLDWNYIKNEIALVYSDPIPHFYNKVDKEHRNKIGIIYIGTNQ